MIIQALNLTSLTPLNRISQTKKNGGTLKGQFYGKIKQFALKK